MRVLLLSTSLSLAEIADDITRMQAIARSSYEGGAALDSARIQASDGVAEIPTRPPTAIMAPDILVQIPPFTPEPDTVYHLVDDTGTLVENVQPDTTISVGRGTSLQRPRIAAINAIGRSESELI